MSERAAKVGELYDIPIYGVDGYAPTCEEMIKQIAQDLWRLKSTLAVDMYRIKSITIERDP